LLQSSAAVVRPEEVARPLWRGLRGELPRSFWLRDGSGMAVAVDQAFTSCSRSHKVPLNFMAEGDEGKNVLVHLRPDTAETDSAMHCGADIGMLSQFSCEEEVLFPPSTMMVLKPWVEDAGLRPWLQERNEDPGTQLISGPNVALDPTSIVAYEFGRLVTETWDDAGVTRSRSYVALKVLPCFI